MFPSLQKSIISVDVPIIFNSGSSVFKFFDKKNYGVLKVLSEKFAALFPVLSDSDKCSYRHYASSNRPDCSP